LDFSAYILLQIFPKREIKISNQRGFLRSRNKLIYKRLAECANVMLTQDSCDRNKKEGFMLG